LFKFDNIKLSSDLNEEQKHLEEKEKCRQLFLFDQQLSKAGGHFLCSSFDLQKVLNTPMGAHTNLYYIYILIYYVNYMVENVDFHFNLEYFRC